MANENLDSPSFGTFGIEDTMEYAGNAELIKDLLAPETSTGDPNKIVPIEKEETKKEEEPKKEETKKNENVIHDFLGGEEEEERKKISIIGIFFLWFKYSSGKYENNIRKNIFQFITASRWI